MTEYRPDNPLIIQGDQTVLAEVGSPRFAEARDRIAPFAELVKSPEHVHTYRISPLSVWNACAAGSGPDEILSALHEFSKYPVPTVVETSIREAATRYGRLRAPPSRASPPRRC
ncbi:MAG TPA: helicase-associated domain-containing protein [Longimicrobium sp.]|nr:helicase-associated domain-containing protein [Longimicrobium sp.]